MEISNFRLIEVIGIGVLSWKFKALVDVTVKDGFFRKAITTEKEVFKTYGGHWYFVDSGEYTPGLQVENLSRKLEAETGKDLHYCLGR